MNSPGFQPGGKGKIKATRLMENHIQDKILLSDGIAMALKSS